jgi:hypothetical protein
MWNLKPFISALFPLESNLQAHQDYDEHVLYGIVAINHELDDAHLH